MISVYLLLDYDLLIPESGSVYLLVFLGFETSELVGEREGDIAVVRMLDHLETLSLVVNFGIGRRAVEQVIAR